MRLILTSFCLLVMLAFLVACTSNENDVVPVAAGKPASSPAHRYPATRGHRRTPSGSYAGTLSHTGGNREPGVDGDPDADA